MTTMLHRGKKTLLLIILLNEVHQGNYSLGVTANTMKDYDPRLCNLIWNFMVLNKIFLLCVLTLLFGKIKYQEL